MAMDAGELEYREEVNDRRGHEKAVKLAQSLIGASAEARHCRFPEIVERITALYSHYCPEKLVRVPSLLKKFEGNEAELLERVLRKYCAGQADLPTDEQALCQSEEAARERLWRQQADAERMERGGTQ